MNNEQLGAATYPGGFWLSHRLFRRKSFTERAATHTVLNLLSRIQLGQLFVEMPDGTEYTFGSSTNSTVNARLMIRDTRCFRRFLTAGDIGFAESYIEGLWDSPDLFGLIHLLAINTAHLRSNLRGNRLLSWLNRLTHRLNHNSRRGSRRNIAYHYDLGNEFYQAWLDPGMTYSSGLFSDKAKTLSEAQIAKYQYIFDRADIHSESRVLEIGCGWAGFIEYATTRNNCAIEGVTLSQRQREYGIRRLQQASLSGRSDITLTDYRDTQGQYDAIVSIEMLEAVGEKHWPDYFDTLYQRLKPGAAAVVQVITIDDTRFDYYRQGADFIQRYIFPGGMLPSPSILKKQSETAGLMMDHEHTFGMSYAKTLAIWRERFSKAWPEIAKFGFDERFRRMWNYYLCYCEAGFRAGTIDVGIYRFRRPC